MGLDRHIGHKWGVALLAVFALACAVLLVIQNRAVRELRNSLRAPTTNLALAGNEQTTATATQSENHDSLADASSSERAEIERLTKLKSQLESEVTQLEQLRNENEQLRT